MSRRSQLIHSLVAPFVPILVILLVAMIQEPCAAQTPVTAPFVENFDSYPNFMNLVPIPGMTGLSASWNYVQQYPSAIAAVVDASNLAIIAPHSTASNAAQVAVLFNAGFPLSGSDTQTLALHIDGLASNAIGLGFRIGAMLYAPPGFSVDPSDIIALVDGVTPGSEITGTGTPGPAAGYLGYKEALLLDWNSAGADQNWMFFEFEIDSAFLAANGMVFSSNMALLIRSSTSSGFLGFTEPLYIDHVVVEPISNAAAPGIVERFDVAWNGGGLGTNALPTGWHQDTTDGYGAIADVLVYSVSIGGSGNDPYEPIVECQTGSSVADYRAVFDDTGDATKRILSPVFTFNAPSCLEFCVAGAAPPTCAENSLYLDLIEYAPSGTSTTQILGPINGLAAGWTTVTATIAPSSSSTTRARLRFRADLNNGTSCKHNFYLDDVIVRTCYRGGGGGFSIPGTSFIGSLDLNSSALNINGLGVASLAPGPYFAGAAIGVVNTIQITGRPNQSAVLLAANLLIGAAFYPGIGQLDLDLGTMTVVASYPLDPTGLAAIPFFLPGPGPYGFYFSVQAAVYEPTSPFGILLTNAVEIYFP